MFTGIVETLGTVLNIVKESGNWHLYIESTLTPELRIDQSVAHNGICLTVVNIDKTVYQVTAIAETIAKTTISHWVVGDIINLERGMKLGDRLDGHIVQGHVDETAQCTAMERLEGSIVYTFTFAATSQNITIEKGSITVNGVSLTVVNSQRNSFQVAIIPYTSEHTNFKYIEVGSWVNLEFDVIGKYITQLQRYSIPLQ